MNTQTLARLRQLKLGGMAAALQTQLEQVGTYEELAFVERLALLVEQECLSREQRKQQRLIRQARFKLHATVQAIDYQHPRNLSPAKIAPLAQGDWISRSHNLLITGPCGSGKTYLGCALGHNACLHGYSVRYYRLSRLLLELTQAKADGSYHKQLKQLAKIQLLIIDDWGLEPLKPAYRNDLWGQKDYPLRLQWMGSVSAISNTLRGSGWRKPPSGAISLLNWFRSQAAPDKIPVLPQVHRGRHETLRFVREAPESSRLEVLRLWPTDVTLHGPGAPLPLWLGSLTRLRSTHPLGLSILRTETGVSLPMEELVATLNPELWETREVTRADPSTPSLTLIRPR